MSLPQKQQLSPIVISQGDAAGVGWELLLKTFQRSKNYYKNIPDLFRRVVVVGDYFDRDEKPVSRLFDVRPFPDDASTVRSDLESRPTKKLPKPLFYYLNKGADYVPGKPGSAVALRSYRAFQAAMRLWKQLGNSSLVTLPVSKEHIIKSGISFSGHTEELAEAYGVKVFMCMYAPGLSVIPLTNHIPLMRVGGALREVDFNALADSLTFFQEMFRPKKGIAMSGLNPHAGEDGAIGKEEFFLKEKLTQMKERALDIDGPWPADALFSPQTRKQYALAIVHYHDQGLIPFKALFGTKGLNITLGLPQLRVSPDHGPAYDIAGSGKADEKSVVNAVRFAARWGEKWIKAYSSRSH